MGKDSLLKSTSKKKGTTSKAAKKAAPKKKVSSKKKAAKKKTPKKKAAVKKKTAAPKAVEKSPVEKSTKKTTKKLSINELVLKKFDTWKPKATFTPPQDESLLKNYAAPPFDKSDQLKGLLSKKFDLEEMKTLGEEYAKKLAKKQIPIEELILQKFDTWKPEVPFAVPQNENIAKNYSAPPFFPDSDKAKTDQVKTILTRKYSMEELKAAAEKAAKEKAEAEKRKTAAIEALEKAAADKAAVEKAETARIAAAKAAAEEKAEKDQLKKTIITLAACILLIVVPLLKTSISNSGKYYLDTRFKKVDVLKGKFAPRGETVIATLEGIRLSEPVKEIYSEEEVYPLIYQYFVDKAIRLDKKGTPDFNQIKADLNSALLYSTSKQTKRDIKKRLAKVDFAILLYKADISVKQGTLTSLKAAKKHLKKARKLKTDRRDKKLAKEKLVAVNQLIKTSKAKARMKPKKEKKAPAKPKTPEKKVAHSTH